jgi:hypothetical protein
MKIENNLLAIFNAMVKNKKEWEYVTDEQKIEFFFIINRLFSKKFPDKSKLLNDRLIDKVSALDTWYLFMLDKPYPKWFWSKSEIKKEKEDISEDEILFLISEFGIKEDDINLINRFYPEVVQEEVQYYRDIKKDSKKK